MSDRRIIIEKVLQEFNEQSLSSEKQDSNLFIAEMVSDISKGDKLDEGLGSLIFGSALSLGKLMDLLGIAYRKVNNKISKNKIIKTKFEEWGGKYNEKMMSGIKWAVEKLGVPKENSEDVAQILFIVVVGTLFGVGSVSEYSGAAFILKMFTQLTKSYEVGVALLAIVLYVSSDEIRKSGDYMGIPHAIEGCTEDKSITKGVKDKSGLVGCVVGKMSEH